jgi:acyl-CoA thioesterase 11/acyl-coenzyme A thioesterase 9
MDPKPSGLRAPAAAGPVDPDLIPAEGDLVRPVEDSMDFVAEIVGDESRQGQRVQAGPILKLMYDAAVAVAFRHCGRRPVLVRLDRIDLTRRIRHMELLRVEGRLVEVGSSSMVVEVRCFSKKPAERDFAPSHVGFYTMVAIDPEGQPSRNIPKLSYDTPRGVEAKALTAHRRAELLERQQALAWIERADRFTVEDVVEPDPVARLDRVPPEQTLIQVKSQLTPLGGAPDGRIRGGDLLVWLDRVATYTARNFTRNDHAITLSVNDVQLKRPLHSTDRIELQARVVYVRTHTLEVSIDITVHTLNGPPWFLGSVDFLILNYDSSGEKLRISTGLLLEESDQDGLRRYLKARTRYSFWKSNPESHLIQSLG